MADLSSGFFLNYLLFLTFPFIFGLIFRKLKLSPIIGYIIGGIILGSFFKEFSSSEAIKSFAYFGILLLLFAVGLETDFNKIFALKKIIIIAGFLQIILSIFFIFLLSLFFGFSLLNSFLIGIALSSSSTTLVAKIIQERGEEASFLGELAIGILIFQDIAFIPFLIIFTSITSNQVSFFIIFWEILISLFKSSVIIFILFYLGKKIIPSIFNKVSRTSREILNLFVIVFIFFITYLSSLIGIPTLIGVFLAGILLSNTLEHYHIFTEIRPLKNILAVIFFVYIGSNANINLIFQSFFPIISFTFLVVFIKFLTLLFIFLSLKFHTKTTFSLASYLFQIDEDAFILLSATFANKLFDYSQYVFLITSVLITLILTPIIIKNKDELYLKIRNFIKRFLPFLENFINYRLDTNKSPIDVLTIKNHIVICGYGRIGSYIGRSLMMAQIPYIAIDYNFYLVEKAKKQGANIIYGDPTDIDILDYAQVEEATILILAVPDRKTQESIILNARKLNKNIFIISRVHREKDQVRMKDLGVNLVIQPEFEASLSIIKRIYRWHNLSKEEIINKINRLKIEHGLL
jgi:CPA2 family monovalent cation:H+ antiporter-2